MVSHVGALRSSLISRSDLSVETKPKRRAEWSLSESRLKGGSLGRLRRQAVLGSLVTFLLS